MQNTPSVVLDRDACYAALKARDARFDGRFFVGIASTGVYCRPVCRVKLPMEKNCAYFASAAAAETAGYRPCLKCRPELAPGAAPVDAAARLARKAAALMEESCLADATLADLAQSMGVTDRHLRRAFAAAYGVSPVQYLQTRRLLLAKALLTDTPLAVTEAALASGFKSIRRFNDLFKERYRLTPSALRKAGKSEAEQPDSLTLLLGYRPPYDWDRLLDFLATRAIPGVESVADGAYRRTIGFWQGETPRFGWLAVAHAPKKNALAVTLDPALLPVLPKVLARTRALFDVNCNPSEISEKLHSLNDLAPGLHKPGTRLPGCFDPFEMSVRAILGQQITVKAARTLAQRLAATLGQSIATPFPDLSVAFPGPETILRLANPVDSLASLGIIQARARSIAALAESLVSGFITFSPGADPEREMEKLLTLPGFGPWTVQYVAMRALGWPDAFPHTDYGVKKALDGLVDPAGMSPQKILELSQAWRPWRSYATIGLWASLANSPSGTGDRKGDAA